MEGIAQTIADRLAEKAERMAHGRRQNAASEYVLTPEQWATLLRVCGRGLSLRATLRNRALIRLLTLPGLRASEAVGLDFDDLTRPDGAGVAWARVYGKGSKWRDVPVPPATFETIEYLADMDGPWIFGKDYRGLESLAGVAVFRAGRTRRMSRKTVWYIVNGAGKAAEIASPNSARVGIHPHMLRHTGAQWMRAAGIPEGVIQQILGHAKRSTTVDLYASAPQSEIARNVGELFASLEA